MTTTFLDYYKMILHKVSFDEHLFIKEYKKAALVLQGNEVGHLDTWLREIGLYTMLTRSLQENHTSKNKQPRLVATKVHQKKSRSYL
jgi:hypothetical protein